MEVDLEQAWKDREELGRQGPGMCSTFSWGEAAGTPPIRTKW